MKKEAVQLGDMEADRIRVCGVAQFDEYWKPPKKTKEEFLRSLNIPMGRRLVLCAPFFGEYSRSSGIMLIKKLAQAIDSGGLPGDLHLLVRYRPEDLNAFDAPFSFHLECFEMCARLLQSRAKRGIVHSQRSSQRPDVHLLCS